MMFWTLSRFLGIVGVVGCLLAAATPAVRHQAHVFFFCLRAAGESLLLAMFAHAGLRFAINKRDRVIMEKAAAAASPAP